MKELIIKIKDANKRLKFIKNNLFITEIKKTVKNFFPKLNSEDLNILEEFTIFMVDFISFKYGFEDKTNYYLQWEQNNYGDVKGVILLLLPFIDDKDNSFLLKTLTDLNHLIYSKSERNIPKKILEIDRNELLTTHFKYGNMGINLLPFSDNSDILLDLYPNDEKIIYKIIEDNFYGLLQTLDIINGKSYINWINIQPLNLNNYHESNLYKKTIEYFKTEAYKYKLNTIDLDYDGIWLGDIFNVLRIKYYEEGKKLKWLFFPFDLQSGSKYLIQILNELIDLEEIINNKYNNFDDLDENDQLQFYKICKEMIRTKLNTGLNIEVIRSLVYWLVNNYSNKKEINKNNDDLIEFDMNKDDDLEDDDDKEKKMKDETVIGAYNFVIENNLNHLWNYLRESIKLLKMSSFGKFLIGNENNKFIIKKDFYYKPFNSNVIDKPIYYLNIKNIYNISKSLNHREDTRDKVLLDKHYISLQYQSRKKFFEKILGANNNWFNIDKNYEKEIKFNPLKSSKDYENYKKNILNDFRDYFIIIVFEELISTGILNQFVPNLKITDKTKLHQDTSLLQKTRKKLIKEMFNKNEKEWKESYYYLTNDKFKNLDKMKISKKQIINPNDKYDEKEYFNVIVEDQEWINFYAMNWISQISFFQHYIFHQVLYVTGATGQGKSTQVPKLLLYASKMYDYNSKANIICTQPRVTPTIENAQRIAEELGLPIEEVSNNSTSKIKTDNYQVQYKYEGGTHNKSRSDHLVLKLVTDGTLLETLITNPTLKKSNKFKDDEEIKDNKNKELKFSNSNYFDIIIIDEAHEHNINMDIIIALAKQSCYVNNQVKLIIVSATMDDDEPIYRRYFKIINDKLVYPIKNKIKNPFFEGPLLFNPLNMDRRYHISPPGETTQYKVIEYYSEKEIDEIDAREMAKKNQELGYQKILEICSKSTLGEILFFCNGKNEILEAVEHLNQVMSPGNIALPFFSELNQTYKEIITKINSKIYNIKNYRENIHLEWTEKYSEDLSVPSGIYKRAIIVATNVAEASITIPGLVYVIDNGFAKENIYNLQLNISKLIVEKISESSRLQRKGRVGRVSDGIVYYLYKKNARKDVKPKYKITTQDITEIVLKLTSNINLSEYLKDPQNYKYSKLIASDLINPNMYKISTNDQNVEDSFAFKYLLELYKKNYMIENDNLSADNFLRENKIGNINIDISLYVYFDGQLFNNMLDVDGLFYLIHPYEKLIKRNILNKIIAFDNKKTSFIPINNYKYFLKSLIDKNLIIDLNANSLYIYYDDIIKDTKEFVKTELTTNILKIKKDFELNKINDATTILAASAMGCLDQVLEIRLLLDLIENLPSNIIKEDIKWDQFKKIYSCFENNSDILFIYDIIKKIKSRFNKLLVFNINNSINKKLDLYVDDQIKIFKKLLKKSNQPPKDYDGQQWNNLINLEINGTLNLKKKDIFIKQSNTSSFIFNDIELYRKEIENWANINYLNSNIIIQFIKKLGIFYLNTIDKYHNNEAILWSKNFTDNFYKCLTDYTIEEKILRSFIYGNPIQFTFNESNRLRTIINFTLYDVSPIIPFESKRKTNDTVATVEDFIFYLNYDQTDNLENDGMDSIEISILNKIKPKWLIPALPLVHNALFNNISQDYKDNIITIKILDSYTIKKLNKDFGNAWTNEYFVWNLSSDKVAPIMHYFYKNIIKVINKLIN